MSSSAGSEDADGDLTLVCRHNLLNFSLLAILYSPSFSCFIGGLAGAF
jgi:hypothetical protein